MLRHRETRIGRESHVMLSASRKIATRRLDSFLASAKVTVSNISLQRQCWSHTCCSHKTGTLTLYITTIKSEFPRCETSKEGNCRVHCWLQKRILNAMMSWTIVTQVQAEVQAASTMTPSDSAETITATCCHNQCEDQGGWVGLYLLRWGCREHFVSGCWYSSGRDCGRYPKECWLSTLGVLHPGVPVMWYGHIRDLSPTAESCMGGRPPNVTLLHWAQQQSNALVGSDGWVDGRLVGQGLHHSSYHTQMHTTQHHRNLSLSLLSWPCSWRDALCSQVRCRGNGWQAINPRCPGCLSVREMRASPEVWEQHRYPPTASCCKGVQW